MNMAFLFNIRVNLFQFQTHPGSALRTIKATGGGAHKYSQLITEKLSLQ